MLKLTWNLGLSALVSPSLRMLAFRFVVLLLVQHSGMYTLDLYRTRRRQ